MKTPVIRTEADAAALWDSCDERRDAIAVYRNGSYKAVTLYLEALAVIGSNGPVRMERRISPQGLAR